jgi:hypothetical protein
MPGSRLDLKLKMLFVKMSIFKCQKGYITRGRQFKNKPRELELTVFRG